MGWYVIKATIQILILSNFVKKGQVLGLFVVGIGEYGVVWLATDWNKEVQKGKERNLLEAKIRAAALREQVLDDDNDV